MYTNLESWYPTELLPGKYACISTQKLVLTAPNYFISYKMSKHYFHPLNTGIQFIYNAH